MTRPDRYFDFISPFSSLPSELLHMFPSKEEIHFKPVLFAGRHWDNKRPAEIAPKRLWNKGKHMSIAFYKPEIAASSTACNVRGLGLKR